MSNNLYTFLAIISAGIGMVICRILPYIIFANGKLPKIVKFYEKYLPFSLMAILFCLCLSTVKFSIYPYGFPEILTLLIVGALQFWKKNVILSLFLGTAIYLAADGKYIGNILISDEVKEDSARAIKGMKENGVKEIVMLTGDNEAIGKNIAEKLGIDKVFTELLPNEKVEKLEEIYKTKSEKGKVAFVGDGINDAPVLARADLGIAMGGAGSDAAIEAADVVIMNDEPSKIVTAIKIAKKTKEIVWQNITIAFAIKIVVMALGLFGDATMWEAVFADVGVALLAVLNATRVLRYNPESSNK